MPTRARIQPVRDVRITFLQTGYPQVISVSFDHTQERATPRVRDGEVENGSTSLPVTLVGFDSCEHASQYSTAAAEPLHLLSILAPKVVLSILEGGMV